MRKIWRLVSLVLVCLALFALSGVAPVASQGDQQQGVEPKELLPSPLEAFAARSTATVVWSKLIGRLDSQEARATITALIIEDTISTPTVMRGLRIDLEHTVANPSCDWKYVAWAIMCKRANAAVYVEEGRLEEVRNRLERGAAELRPWEFISQYESSVGSVQVSSGLIICGYQFAHRRRSELAALFTRAIAELRAASR
ncbi:MAG TPA: hypothetical protein VGX03_21700 [Candidatus Binatia bacterium]|nr:hypothetical protein [Candidatus Binatia bacterium]